MEIKEPKFKLLQEVYHITPGSGKGIILDITYYFSINAFKYYVTFGINNDAWCVEEKLYIKNN
jgi:hypothetical protein